MSYPITSDLHARILAILADVLQQEIPAETSSVERARTPAWDSLSHLRLLIELEEIFGISIGDLEGVSIRSSRDVEELLRKRGIA